jgi:uncharacterized protein (UPF0332 family)
MAGFHAALAIVVARSGKEPKTHNGVHAEFARLARADPNLGQDLVTFLSRAYGLKSFADYDDGNPVTRSEAQASLDLAEQFVDRIAAML